MAKSAIGIIGGSGLYQLPGLESRREIALDTPFGAPSDSIVQGELGGRELLFLPRHGRGHRLLPTEIPHQANLWALRSLGVRFLICVTAVGSLREELAPRDLVLVDQFFDRSSRRDRHSFFGAGIVGHVAFAEPLSAALRGLLAETAAELGLRHHRGGTYVCMDGPAFSTRAESERNRRDGFDVIGMTNLPEAKLAREAEIACATIACVTDYDAWKDEHVTAAAVMAHTQANAESARRLIAAVVPKIPEQPTWPEHRALAGAIMTPRAHWPAERTEVLGPLLGDLARFG